MGTGVQGRSGGKDIVDENQVTVLHGGILAYGEGPAQVFHSVAAGEMGLSGGVSGPFQSVANLQIQGVCRDFGKDCRLIKMSFSEFCRVEGDRDEKIWWWELQTRVCKSLCEPDSQWVPEMVGQLVFKSLNQIPD